ncbi:hydrophobic surface binding protein A-domain-containing protein [Vararia minispora EC-137]|uniref:Hydrophobic surface binding protein A-domain-containing protein n=1 Tax=Vararia minispora EC-137 TaxID=1314806 RepID=A0ACB8QZS1_9AGAM|nr:hydrophobic surface binding protein A-domain-containing protein [Vararia minispora EC-137]
MRFAFFSLIVALVVSAVPVKRNAATVETDIANINTQVNNLNTAINTFAASPTLVNGLAIHTGAAPLESAVNTATSDTNASAAFTEAEGQTILTAIQSLATNVISTLSNLDGQHAKFAALPLAGSVQLVELDLQTLSSDTTAFENALIAKAPADLVPQANQVVSAISAAFSTAIATYAS